MNKSLKELHKFLSGHPDINVSLDEPMSKHTSFKIGGPAELFCELKTESVVVRAVEKARELGIKPFIIGNGTNLLVDDEGIPGAVFKIACSDWYVSNKNISVEAGAPLTKVAMAAKRVELTGFEFAYGIPGTMGGAVVMNAGAYGGEMSQVITDVTFLDENGYMNKFSNESAEFGYRTSYFKKNPNCIVLSANIKLQYGKKEEIEAYMADLLNRRKEKQPLEYPSAGSVFKRPEGYFAGALVEQCGLKGFSIGGAQVSEKHAGFIINRGGATCADVLNLIEHIQKTVLREQGVNLECEVLYAPIKK